MKRHIPRLALLILWLALPLSARGQAATETARGTVWRESTFEDFVDGTFGDAGVNTYVSANGRIQTINRWDLNRDGFIDILMPNSHPLVEMLDMSIYWGNGKDFSIRNHDYVPADGPMWVEPADLNADGQMDLVVANYSNGTWTSMDSAVYWGGLARDQKPPEGKWGSYPFLGKTNLPGQNTQGVGVGDFDGDGDQDIVFAYSAGFWEYRGAATKEFPARIYWNKNNDYSPENFVEIPTGGATDVDIADFNGDGRPDLVFSSESENSYIFLNTGKGYDPDDRIALPTTTPHAVTAADLDNDGDTDVVFAQEIAGPSVAYLNEGGAFDPARKLEFETHYAKDAVVADFNKDGFNDVFFTNHLEAINVEKRFGNPFMPSFLYYGSADGFSPDKRVELPTMGAWGANAADLNEDGWIDLLICNFKEYYSYEVPSFLYWGGPDGFEVTRRTPLYEHGAQGNAIADFDGDGHLDILITSMMGRSRGDYDPNWIYFGNRDGQYSVDNRIEFPGRETYEQAMADLDDDGQTDFLLQNQGEVMRWENEVWIYWNEQNKFDPWVMTGLPTHAGLAVEVADLDRDGYLDIISASGKSYAGVKGETEAGFPIAKPGSFIYWGSADGWAVTERTALNVAATRGPTIADLNADGQLDLLFSGTGSSIFWGDGTRNFGDDRRQAITTKGNHMADAADLNQDGHLDLAFAGEPVRVIYGDGQGNFPEDKTVILECQAKTMNVQDINGDGWLDLICPFYKVGGLRSVDSWILLGGPEGFDIERRIELFNDGGTGAIPSDFNFDGYMDVFFYNHRADGSAEIPGRYGDHKTDSRLYFNGPNGFDEENYVKIPSIGVHYDVGADLGHVVDRTFAWDYMSSPRDTGGATPATLDWTAETPHGMAVKFQLRSADSEDALAQAEWTGPNGPDSFYTESGAAIDNLPEGRWLQYRAVLETVNGADSPVLEMVEVQFE